MDDFKIIKVEIDPDTDAIRIEASKDNILFKIESYIHISEYTGRYYIPLYYHRNNILVGFISEKLNDFALELRIPFVRSAYCPRCKYKKDLIKILKLLLIEEEL